MWGDENAWWTRYADSRGKLIAKQTCVELEKALQSELCGLAEAVQTQGGAETQHMRTCMSHMAFVRGITQLMT